MQVHSLVPSLQLTRHYLTQEAISTPGSSNSSTITYHYIRVAVLLKIAAVGICICRAACCSMSESEV